MLSNKHYILILFFLISITIGKSQSIANELNTGLTFLSHSVNQDERTYLALTPHRPLSFPQGFTLEFELKLTEIYNTFGYVFRVAVNDTSSFDMISSYYARNINFILSNSQKPQASSRFTLPNQNDKEHWMKIIVHFNPTEISHSIDGIEKKIAHSFQSFKKVNIYFGANRSRGFNTTDVPPMTIRNLIIRDDKDRPVREWKMDKHGTNIVWDNIADSPATVYNGIWEMDKHITWENIGSLAFNEQNPQLAYDTINGRIFAALKNQLHIFHIETGQCETINVKGSPFHGVASQLIYDYKNDQLISYSIEHPRLVTFNFETNEWSDSPKEKLLSIQHHNRCLLPETNQLVVFGGYAKYRYNADLSVHDPDKSEWSATSLSDSISPRYLSSSTYLENNKILLFGGRGSHSGSQDESPTNYYDLHVIDVQTKKSTRLGELSNVRRNLAFGNSMVINKTQTKLYTLAYSNDRYHSAVQLYQIDLKTFGHAALADSIPYKFLDTESFCDLFLYGKTKKLYAIVSQKQDENLYSVDFYSLSYLPLAASDVMQIQPARNNLYLFVSGSAFISSLIILLWFFLHHYTKKEINQEVLPNIPADTTIPLPPLDVPMNKHPVSSILLLGGFQIFNMHGDDITGQFTPIIRQLFLRILLESVANGKGVTSQQLDETFWSDMDKTSAVNNRSVNMRKLRIILGQLGEVKIISKNSYWSVSLGNDVYCDYSQIIALLTSVNTTKTFDKTIIEKITLISSSGVLIPDANIDWIDKYKSDFSNRLIEILQEATLNPDIQQEFKLLIKISDVILLHDSIDEDAIQLKCRSLYQLGQKGFSKQCFDKFCAEYIQLLGEEPKFSYETLIAEISK